MAKIVGQVEPDKPWSATIRCANASSARAPAVDGCFRKIEIEVEDITVSDDGDGHYFWSVKCPACGQLLYPEWQVPKVAMRMALDYQEKKKRRLQELEKAKPAPMAIPTSSVIAHREGDPFQVYVIKQAKKHNRRLMMVGGRVALPQQTHFDCARAKWDQEAGGLGATLVDLQKWGVRWDPSVDVREITLGKATNNLCPPELRNLPVMGHYGLPDTIFVASVNGTPHPKNGEAEKVVLLDVREIVITENEADSQFGAQHDLVLALYARLLEGRDLKVNDLSNFKALRAELLRTQG